ncbi:restriction endonuclease [Brazilian marseillevirus]|uniref:HNH endonuclease n=1 Tax=Brazilian marseillevirus TaxID=1813599 RepID=UPI000783C800|nr:HNH endonuclease [Brazilian marseillevirus]AMQ10801.1 restriction endonuclease [Brazilian marseillevirus]
MNSKIPCPERKQGLCGFESCVHCFPKSFASHSLSKHWSKKNKEDPKVVVLTSRKVFLFVCDCGHEYERKPFDVVKRGLLCLFCKGEKLCDSEGCEMCKINSFASHEKSQFWSTKNNFSPETITKKHSKKCWFACPDCSHSFQQEPRVVCLPDKNKGRRWCPYCTNQKKCEDETCERCYEKSFASVGTDLVWSKKNTVSEREVSAGSHKKYWFDCERCGHDFEMTLFCISTQRQGCPFCSGQRRCVEDSCEMCFKRSFASHKFSENWSKENKKPAREVAKSSTKKYWFDCDKCPHAFEMSIDNINAGQNCPFCARQKLCDSPDCKMCFDGSFAGFPEASFWSQENERTPRSVRKGTGKKYKFICEKKHSFESSPRNIRSGNWCPLCKKKTEAKLLRYLESIHDNVIYQFTPEWSRNPKTGKLLPFDFCVSSTIIELDGPQHFRQISNWTPPEETRERDQLKEQLAKDNGYVILRILQEDVWNDSGEWKRMLSDL